MRFVAIFDKDFSLDHTSVDGDAVWLIESPANRALANKLSGLSRKAILFGDNRNPDNQMVLDIVGAVSHQHPEWTEIDIIGMFPNQLLVANLVAPRGSFSGIYVTELREFASGEVSPLGFMLTKTLPKSRADRMEIWRQNLPPAGLLAITDRALRRIVDRRDDLRKSEPGTDWIPSLEWGSGAARGPDDDDWRATGIGFALGFAPRSFFPVEAIELRSGMEIVFRLGFDFAFFKGKTVDFVEGSGGFVLVDL
jgi:hypothetical protein